MDPLTVLGAVSTTLGIIDKISGQIERYKKKQPEPAAPPQPSVLSARVGNEVVLSRYGTPFEKITPDDFKNLSENDQRLIKALEDAMQRNYRLWTTVYPQRNASPDPLVNARIDAQLDQIAKDMCGDLERILRFLESLGKQLQDHYASIRFVCSSITGP